MSIQEDGVIYGHRNSQNDEFPHFIEHLHSQTKRMEELLAKKSAHPMPDNSSDSSTRRADLDGIKRQIFYAWCLLIEGYSKCCFTVHSDRLPAISDVATKMAAAAGDVYLQAIWQSDLSHGLAWSRKEPRSFVEECVPSNGEPIHSTWQIPGVCTVLVVAAFIKRVPLESLQFQQSIVDLPA